MARNAGISWTDWFERHGRRSKTLLVALPLLLLSLVLDQGGQSPQRTADQISRAADTADPAASPPDQEKARTHGDAGTQVSDASRSKFTPSGGNTGGGILIPPLPRTPRHGTVAADPRPTALRVIAPLAAQNGPRAPPVLQG